MVDLIIIVVLALYVFMHIREGFFALSARLLALIGGAMLAFVTYSRVSHLLALHTALTPGMSDALSFLIMFIIFKMVIGMLLNYLFSFLPIEAHYSTGSRIAAVLPALADGLIVTALVLFIIVVGPFFTSFKQPIEESKIGGPLVSTVASSETSLDKVFGQATQETLSMLTVEPKEGESISLPFKATNLSVDEASEAKMLELVNAERAKVGAKPLVLDQTLVAVARAHSTDMWARSYFAHTDPDGKSPFDRMTVAGVKAYYMGENLALARTVERAHEGLMNSPGHKRNILDPDFGHVGIGVIDGGVYGKMFTQDFTN